MRRGSRLLTCGGVAVIAVTVTVLSAQERALTPEQMGEFLRTAEIVNSERTRKGLTQPWRLTLSDGRMTHDASFQSVNIRRNNASFRGGGAELNFVDSFAYNIAAYRLAGRVGLGGGTEEGCPRQDQQHPPPGVHREGRSHGRISK